jgi:hypothetical protein
LPDFRIATQRSEDIFNNHQNRRPPFDTAEGHIQLIDYSKGDTTYVLSVFEPFISLVSERNPVSRPPAGILYFLDRANLGRDARTGLNH